MDKFGEGKAEAPYTLRQLIIYFLRLGTFGFGGPVALIGFMHRDLVENNKWITAENYKEGLALAELAPGPLAAQLAIYLGYVHYRILGATLAGIAFVLPSFLMVVLLGFLYVKANGLPWIRAVFYGIGASVIGIIAISSYRLTRKSLGKDRLLWIIFLVLAITTFVTEKENVALILISGFLVWLYKSPPKFGRTGSAALFFAPVVLLQMAINVTRSEKLVQMGWYFFKAGALVFGSGLAIVPFLYGGVVKHYQWLTEQEFLDAVAIAMITPGPVVITVGFIGYLVAGFQGAAVAAMATFFPCYLFTVLPAPYFRKYGNSKTLKAIVEGITSAAIGAIAGAVLVLAKRQLQDPISLIIALGTILILTKTKKIKEPQIILIAAIIGLLIKKLLN